MTFSCCSDRPGRPPSRPSGRGPGPGGLSFANTVSGPPDGRPWSFGGRLETLETAYETGCSVSLAVGRCPVARTSGAAEAAREQRTVAGWWREIGRV